MKSVGKKVFEDYDLHITALRHLPADDYKAAVQEAIEKLPELDKLKVNVIKINLRSKRVSLLEYSNFESDSFPILAGGWIFEPEAQDLRYRTYLNSSNPPILHRKELLVDIDFPMREQWIRVTQEADSIGLFDDTTTIGFKKNWEKRIFDLGFKLHGNQFVPIGNDSSETEGIFSEKVKSVQRHLTALSRATLSAPVQLLIKNGLLSSEQTFFDYGCGRGTDVFTLEEAGIQAAGWDLLPLTEN